MPYEFSIITITSVFIENIVHIIVANKKYGKLFTMLMTTCLIEFNDFNLVLVAKAKNIH
jgi:hypothetical protein